VNAVSAIDCLVYAAYTLGILLLVDLLPSGRRRGASPDP
jgi:hypothetical protein